MTTAQKLTAVFETLEAIRMAIVESGQNGMPGGTIYASLMRLGATHSEYETLMSILVKSGKVSKHGQLYKAVA